MLKTAWRTGPLDVALVLELRTPDTSGNSVASASILFVQDAHIDRGEGGA